MNSIIEYFDGLVNENEVLGAVCAVYKREKEIFRYATGYCNAERTKPQTEDGIFRLASMTKPITAVAVMICVERGLLDLDAPISQYIKGFSHSGVGKLVEGEIVFEKPSKELTIRQMLSHSSGLGSGEVGNLQWSRMKKPATLQEAVEGFHGWYLDFEAGTAQAYSPFMAMEIAARAVEIVTGVSYGEFLEKEIFIPLGMKDTTHRLSKEQLSRKHEMCIRKEKRFEISEFETGFEAFVDGYTGASAGLYSTLDDYANFARMLSGKGVFNGKRILSEESVAEISKPQLPKTIAGVGDYFNWGLGVRVLEKQGEHQPLPDGSFGWSGAYGTHFWIEPKTGISAVLMLNAKDALGAGSPYSYRFEQLVQREFGENK